MQLRMLIQHADDRAQEAGGERGWSGSTCRWRLYGRHDQPAVHAYNLARMDRIRFDFGVLALEAELLDTPTAKAIAQALPISSSVLTWGEEVYFDVPVVVAREKDARAVITPGGIAYWPQGPTIAIGFGRTPISKGNETRLASPCNVFAKALGSVKTLGKVRPGTKVAVTTID